MTNNLDVTAVRRQFPALTREIGGRPVAFFDGPAGSQVPQRVADAVSRYLLETNANHGGAFATTQESDRLLDQAHATVADFIGARDADCVVFGPNMTTLTLSLSRAMSRTWQPGDEIIVSSLDHDANVSPWVLAAHDAQVTVRRIPVILNDCTLDLNAFEALLTPRTRLVAVGYASNATGTINPLRTIIDKAHAVGAQVFVDAVHYAPHGLIDVESLQCDWLACSAYKFFGPHVGILWGRRELLESVTPYKLRPAPESLPGRWMTGTQSHEGIAGVAEAIEYLADLGRSLDTSADSRRGALIAAYDGIGRHEQQLAARLIDGLMSIPDLRIWGITEAQELINRVPTISCTHSRLKPRAIAEHLSNVGIFAWTGNHYALPFTEAAGLEPDGTLRVGALHYNTVDEVDRVVATLRERILLAK